MASITLEGECVKYVNSRKTSYTYGEVMRAFDRVKWRYIDSGTMIVKFHKTFLSEAAALVGKKAVEQALRNVHRNITYRWLPIKKG